jgi:hypothetical protein
MDIKDLLSRLDTINEAANPAQQAAIAIDMKKQHKKPKQEGATGPNFTGYWKGTDKSVPGKRMVGGESILRDLERKLDETPVRDLMREYREFKEATPAQPQQPQQPAQQPGNTPTLGADLTKPGTPQQQQQQDPAQAAAQQKLAQQEKAEQNNLQKGVASLKMAGAAVNNPANLTKAFGKVDDQQGLNPADKGAIASAGTVLAPIMSNPQLQGKFKDLVTQASAEQKKQQQTQQQVATPPGAKQITPGTPA